MSLAYDLKLVACKVFSLLTDEPETRDDDRLLMALIWKKETAATTAEALFKELIEGKLSHSESVCRMRRKIQEKHPNLRGKTWDVRHKMEGAICQQLTFFDRW